MFTQILDIFMVTSEYNIAHFLLWQLKDMAIKSMALTNQLGFMVA